MDQSRAVHQPDSSLYAATWIHAVGWAVPDRHEKFRHVSLDVGSGKACLACTFGLMGQVSPYPWISDAEKVGVGWRR
nr:hypothetical protein Iba_chr05cCG13530 [Ipomoea batatas]